MPTLSLRLNNVMSSAYKLYTQELKRQAGNFCKYPESSFSLKQEVWEPEEMSRGKVDRSGQLPLPFLAAAPLSRDHGVGCAFLEVVLNLGDTYFIIGDVDLLLSVMTMLLAVHS